MLQAGYAPLGMVMGVCVYHVAHRTFGNVLSNIGQNAELPQFTQALYDARELAMARMQKEAEALHAEGIVGVDLSSAQPHVGLAHDRVLRDRYGRTSAARRPRDRDPAANPGSRPVSGSRQRRRDVRADRSVIDEVGAARIGAIV